MWMVAADVVALVATPLLDGLLQRPGWNRFVTDLSRVGLAGLVLLQLVPHGWEVLGPVALGLFGAGVAGVLALEWAQHRGGRGAGFVDATAVGALVVHHLVDGIGLALAATSPSLGLAVVLHAVPAALVGWRLGVERGGTPLGWAVIGAMVGSTAVGYGLGLLGSAVVAERLAIGASCLLGGGLLHALFHLPSDPVRRPWMSVGTTVAGIGLIAVLLALDDEPGMYTLPPTAAVGLVAVAVGSVWLGARAHRPLAG